MENKPEKRYVLGIDFGTDSCRTLLVDALTGEEIDSVVAYYPRWKQGLYCDPVINQYRQHPLDYIESMEKAVKETVEKWGSEVAGRIEGIGIDTTGSTPVLLDQEGLPLALRPEFSDNPNAMFVLWKDHTAVQEAEEINTLAREWGTDFTAYSGRVYSSEWVWAKMLHVLRVDPVIREQAYSWTEHCDWMPALLTGNTSPEKMLRSRCAAGHKAMWNEEWGGLPSNDFLSALDPLLTIFHGHLYTQTYTSDTSAGYLTPEWAERLGLSTRVAVCVGALDCHFGAVGVQITPRTLVRVMGTSTCDVMVSSYEEIANRTIEGICGQVDGSVLPGMIGLEAGQSGFGDVYAWFRNILLWPASRLLPMYLDEGTATNVYEKMERELLNYLTEEASRMETDKAIPLSLDWLNGRRTPLADQRVTGLISGLTIGTTAPMIFKSLVNATAYGSKAIVDCFLDQGIGIDNIIAIGGISQKSPFVMQTLADVLNIPIRVSAAEQACALGGSMFAAVVAGIYPNLKEAQAKMGKGFSHIYMPDDKKAAIYKEYYKNYLNWGQFTEEQS